MKPCQVNQRLPIQDKIAEFQKSIDTNQVVIVRAPTGTGKSTMLPLAAYQTGHFDKIVVTVPTRIAATTLAKRVSELTNSPLGDIVGYQTGFEKMPGKYLNYTTEGFELMNALNFEDKNNGERTIVFIDEIHNWSTNIEALVAWVRMRIKNGWKAKVVLMSATIEVDKLSYFFENAPIIKVESRGYPVQQLTATPDKFYDAIVSAVEKGKNTLAFVPGKQEILETSNAVIARLQKRNITNFIVIPIHGEMNHEDQLKAFVDSEATKIVISTNVCQSSVTIEGTEVVVDSGLERHIENVNGFETLTIGPISKSDHIQRMGRAGRVAPGVYIWCGPKPIEELKEYSLPEILVSNTSLAQVTLRLANVGVSINDMEFYHMPTKEDIKMCMKSLQTLGAFDSNDNITLIGKYMAAMPISFRYARMLVEANRLNVLEDVIIIACILELGGLKPYKAKYTSIMNNARGPIGSDMLAELDLFRFVQKQLLDNNPVKEINTKTYYRILELRSKLYDVLPVIFGREIESTGNRRDIIKACCAGLVEYIYIKEPSSDWYTCSNDNTRRKIDKYSMAFPTEYIVGIPRNISYTCEHTENGLQTLYVISYANQVTLADLVEIAPQLTRKLVTHNYDPTNNKYYRVEKTFFGNLLLSESTEKVVNNDEKRVIIIDWLSRNTLFQSSDVPIHLARTFNKNREAFKDDPMKIHEFYTKAFKNVVGGIPNFANSKSTNLITAHRTQYPH